MITDQEELARRLSNKGYRLTKQRLAVLKALQGTKSHPNANWIYEKVRKEIPHVSLGTIYRTLGILKEAGLLRELDYGSSLSHYDANTENHAHIVCTNCGRIDDLPLSLPLASHPSTLSGLAQSWRKRDRGQGAPTSPSTPAWHALPAPRPGKYRGRLERGSPGGQASWARGQADELEEQASKATDYLITDHRLEFYGLCPDCRPG